MDLQPTGPAAAGFWTLLVVIALLVTWGAVAVFAGVRRRRRHFRETIEHAQLGSAAFGTGTHAPAEQVVTPAEESAAGEERPRRAG